MPLKLIYLSTLVNLNDLRLVHSWQYILELREIQKECEEKKHTLQLAQNSQRRGWIELDVNGYNMKDSHQDRVGRYT